MTPIRIPTSDSFIEVTRCDNHSGRNLRVEILSSGFVRTDPQAVVDALAELFPDMKPSPPKPKVGDRVLLGDPVGTMARTVLAVHGSYGWLEMPSKPGTFFLKDMTVVERGES